MPAQINAFKIAPLGFSLLLVACQSSVPIVVQEEPQPGRTRVFWRCSAPNLGCGHYTGGDSVVMHFSEKSPSFANAGTYLVTKTENDNLVTGTLKSGEPFYCKKITFNLEERKQ